MIPGVNDSSSNMFPCILVSVVSMRSDWAMARLEGAVGAYVSVLFPLFKPYMSARSSNARKVVIVPILVAFRMFCARSVSVLVAMSVQALLFLGFSKVSEPRHIDVSAAACTETRV